MRALLQGTPLPNSPVKRRHYYGCRWVVVYPAIAVPTGFVVWQRRQPAGEQTTKTTTTNTIHNNNNQEVSPLVGGERTHERRDIIASFCFFARCIGIIMTRKRSISEWARYHTYMHASKPTTARAKTCCGGGSNNKYQIQQQGLLYRRLRTSDTGPQPRRATDFGRSVVGGWSIRYTGDWTY
jgi:hypothetical protein